MITYSDAARPGRKPAGRPRGGHGAGVEPDPDRRPLPPRHPHRRRRRELRRWPGDEALPPGAGGCPVGRARCAMVVAIIVVAVLSSWLVLIFIRINNSMIGARNRVDEAWSGIDVQLKRRHDLVPNLVETVKGYATHERETFEKVTEARAEAMKAQGPAAGERRRGSADRGARRPARGRREVPRPAGDRELPAALAQPERARGRDPGLAPDLQLERAGLQHEDPGVPELDRRRDAAASRRASSSRSRTRPSASRSRSRFTQPPAPAS